MRRARRANLQHGVTLIETLVAGAILATSLAGMVSMWYFSFGLTRQTDTSGIAYNVGRAEIEQVRETGFGYTAETNVPATTYSYYDANGVPLSSSTGAAYQVNTTVNSSACKSGTINTNSCVPADTALRTVSVKVYAISNTSTVLYQTYTYLVRNGL